VLESDLDRMTFSQVMMDLLDKTITHSESQESIFILALTSLQKLNQLNLPIYWTYWSFHFQLLSHLGFHFETDECHHCHGPLGEGSILTLNQELLCENCGVRSPEVTHISEKTLKILRNLSKAQNSPYNYYSKSERHNIWTFLWQYTHFHLESTRYMKSLDVLQQIYGTL
jgi:DNA repair protein RecO